MYRHDEHQQADGVDGHQIPLPEQAPRTAQHTTFTVIAVTVIQYDTHGRT